MDKLNVDKHEKKLCRKFGEYGGEMPFECRITLPDYLGDVTRILRCTVCAVPDGAAREGDKITVRGDIRVKISYLSDNGGAYVYETGEQFAKSADAQGLPEDYSVIYDANADRTVCRALSPRSLEVKSVIVVRCAVYERAERSLVERADGCGVFLRTETADIFDIESAACKVFTVDGSYSLPAERNAVLRVIACDASSRITETRMIANKAMIRGESEVRVLYISESSEMPESVTFTVPFSELADAAGIGEGMSARVFSKVLCADAAAKAARGGDMREISCSLSVYVSLVAGKTEKTEIAVDAFSTMYETTSDYVAVTAVQESRSLAESFIYEGEIALDGLAGQRLVWHSERITGAVFGSDGSEVAAEGRICVCMFFAGVDGGLSYAERSVDFNYKKSFSGAADFSPVLTTGGAEIAPDGEKIYVRGEIFIEGRLDAVRERNALAVISIDEDKTKSSPGAGLVIYFPSPGESIWDVAKRYNTSPDVLSRENGDLSGASPMLISCV